MFYHLPDLSLKQFYIRETSITEPLQNKDL